MVKDDSEQGLIQIFDWLRFPLIIGVIFIHNHQFSNNCISSGYKWGGVVIELFSQEIGRLSVPIFFIISGYLFFHNIDALTTEIWIQKLKRRIKSLLIPYLIWNVVVGLCYIFIWNLNGSDNMHMIGAGRFWFESLIGKMRETGAFPIVFQMWYIRDLMCVVLLSPILYFFLKKVGFLFVPCIGVLWIFGIELPVLGNYCLSMAAIFYFGLGAYFTINGFSYMACVRKVRCLGFVYPLLVTADILYGSKALHNFGILSGIILIFYICGYLAKSGRLKSVSFLSSASFFVFAIHEPLLSHVVRSLTSKILPNHLIIAQYFISVGLIVGISLIIYYAMRKFFPKVTGIVCGGR